MIKEKVKNIVDNCFRQGVSEGYWSHGAAGLYTIEEPKHKGQGDLATNLAMIIAGQDKNPPRQVASQLVELLRTDTELLLKVEVAGPGFINFFIKENVWQQLLSEICEQNFAFGQSMIGQNQRVLVEFVSANPTGPLSVGHGRQAVLGDVIARLLIATGHKVDREYYYNDAGRQMRVLGESTRARYLEILELPFDFPEDGYQGEYIRDIAQNLIDETGDSLKESSDITIFTKRAEESIFAGINSTLTRLKIKFNNYYNEYSLYENGLIDDVVAVLRTKGLVYEKDDAVWFKTTEFSHDKDRVIIKSTGEPTYRLPDIAYHREKFRRGYEWLIDILGSDHIATVPDVLAGIRALGYDDSKVSVVIHQFVTLIKDGQQVKMSTRKANFITIDELLDEVSADVVRFFFLMRKADSQLDFDIDLAKKESQENPVFYVQYAHARLSSIGKKAAIEGVDKGSLASAPLFRLTLAAELDMIKTMAGYPELIENAALDLAPHRLVFFLQTLAGQFHSYYNKYRVISNDSELSQARLWLAEAMQIVLRNGLQLIGVKAPDVM